jgi:hypothetical protein
MAKRNKEKAEVLRMVQIGQMCSFVAILTPAELKKWLKSVPAELRKGPSPDDDLSLGMLVTTARWQDPELLDAMHGILATARGAAADHNVSRRLKLTRILKTLAGMTEAGLERIQGIIWDEQPEDDDGDPASKSVGPK